MAFVINVKDKPLEIKFNYRMMFKANKELGSINEETGKNNEDGASQLFMNIMNQDDTAIFELIRLAGSNKSKFTENDIFTAIEGKLEEYMEDGKTEAEAYDALFNDIKEEMLDSGFFMRKLEKQIENMEKGKKILAEREDKDSQSQAKAIEELIASIKNEIS